MLVRRITALLMSLCALQLTLLDGVRLCADGRGGADGVSAIADMAGMDMAGMDMGAVSERSRPGDNARSNAGASGVSGEACDRAAPDDACDTSHADDCGAMTTCAPILLEPDARASSHPMSRRSDVPATSVQTLLTRSTAPESPPPRA